MGAPQGMADFYAEKRAGQALDWAIDYRPWLNGQGTMMSSSWSVSPVGVTLTDQENDGGKVGVTVATGGSAGDIYLLTNVAIPSHNQDLVQVKVIELYISP